MRSPFPQFPCKKLTENVSAYANFLSSIFDIAFCHYICIICQIDMKLNYFSLSYYRFIMLFIAFQVIIFTIIVDESLGCFNCPSGRSLTEREVKFVKHRDFQYCFWCLLFQSYYYSFSLATWIRYIGHLECAPKMKRLV